MNFQINEKLGIAESTTFYVDLISNKIFNEFKSFRKKSHRINQKEVIYIIINQPEIEESVTNLPIYLEFPVSNILIDLSIIEKKPSDLQKIRFGRREKSNVVYKVGGFASPFGRDRASSKIKNPITLMSDHSVSIHMDIEIDFTSGYRPNIHDNKIKLKIETVILHELNHIYEYYKRKINKSPLIDVSLTYAAISSNKMRRPKKVFDYWQSYFTDYIYMSEPHEIRAYIQESKALIDKMEFSNFQKTDIWKIPKYMENYNYKEFQKNINLIIDKYSPKYSSRIIDLLREDFIKSYKEKLEEWKESPIISLDNLEKMDNEEFFKFWENIIRKAGKSIIRGMIRLYTYKKID